jgi:tetratricopeptide (TPR) repeat protein
MTKQLHPFILFLLLSFVVPPPMPAMGRTPTAAIVDDEYDRYKKRGDDLFKEGKYLEARRQYQNCLEVPGFENDTYAKGQIEECTAGLRLRQLVEEAMRQGKGAELVNLFSQLLNLNPDDALTKAQITDYYERIGNQLFNQKRYVEARENYTKALSYTTTRQETLRLQIRTIDNQLKPKHIGLKLFTGAVAVGVGAYAILLRSDYQSKMTTLNEVSQAVDPTNSGIIGPSDDYRKYEEAYRAAETAQQKNGLFKACLGVAAVATIAEVYLLMHKPKPRTAGLHWKPSSQSVGLAVGYTF